MRNVAILIGVFATGALLWFSFLKIRSLLWARQFRLRNEWMLAASDDASGRLKKVEAAGIVDPPKDLTSRERDEYFSAKKWDEITALEAAEKYPARFGKFDIALCLSGGGYRAAIYHLGALRRLNELGILSKVDTISAVSGGSIIAAHLVEHLAPWPERGTVAKDFEEKVAAPFRKFVSKDIRTKPALAHLIPFQNAQAKLLTKAYSQGISTKRLVDLPVRPNLVFCATDVTFGIPWCATRDIIGNSIAYFLPSNAWTVARAVAASSAFPPVFRPISAKLRRQDQVLIWRGFPTTAYPVHRELQNLQLTDGGNFDNLGILPVYNRHRLTLISVGELQDPMPFASSGLLRGLETVGRHAGITSKSAGFFRDLWLAEHLSGAVWRIEHPSEIEADTASGFSSLMSLRIANIRTDMNGFTEAEIAILENHGYMSVEAAMSNAERSVGHPNRMNFALEREFDTPVCIPHPEWLAEPRCTEAIRFSHDRFARLRRRREEIWADRLEWLRPRNNDEE